MSDIFKGLYPPLPKHLEAQVDRLEQELQESRELENKWLRIAQELERRNEALEEAAQATVDEWRNSCSTEAIRALEVVLEDNDVKGE